MTAFVVARGLLFLTSCNSYLDECIGLDEEEGRGSANPDLSDEAVAAELKGVPSFDCGRETERRRDALRDGDAPVRTDLEDGHREVVTPSELIEEALLLPPGCVAAAQSDQDVVRVKAVDRIVEGREGRFVADVAGGRQVHLVHLPEHDSQTLVCLMTRAVCVGDPPLQSPGQDWRYHKDVGGSIEKAANERRQFIHVRDGCAGCDKKSRSTRI